MALLALDALRPLLLEAKRADEDAAAPVVHVVAGIRDVSVDGEKAWLLLPKSRTEQTAVAAAAVAVTNLIFSLATSRLASLLLLCGQLLSKPSQNACNAELSTVLSTDAERKSFLFDAKRPFLTCF